jgi:hypothetical protein
MKYEYEVIKTKKIVDRYTITSTDKLSIDEIEENVREEFLYVGQSNKFKLDHMTQETTYIGQDDILSEERIDVVGGHGDINHED